MNDEFNYYDIFDDERFPVNMYGERMYQPPKYDHEFEKYPPTNNLCINRVDFKRITLDGRQRDDTKERNKHKNVFRYCNDFLQDFYNNNQKMYNMFGYNQKEKFEQELYAMVLKKHIKRTRYDPCILDCAKFVYKAYEPLNWNFIK